MKVTKATLRVRFAAVKDALRANPERYDQGAFCGTTCCIAGWLDMLEHGAAAHKAKAPPQVYFSAVELIGAREMPWIFGWVKAAWPDDLRNAFFFAATRKAEVEVACKAIDRYVAERCA